MAKILIVPDSFKGTLSAQRICEIAKEEAASLLPHAEVVTLPIADGGEGSVDCFLAAAGGVKVSVSVKGPHFDDVNAFYGILPDGKTAVIEMAAAAGLPLVGNDKNPMVTTTYGVGQLIWAAVQAGCDRIILGLGGSATNDGGCGMAAALGVTFYDRDGEEMLPVGGTLSEIDRIDRSTCMLPNHVTITAMCDIDNPLYGESGAAWVFGPQKGATAEVCALLDEGLRHLAQVIKEDLHIDVSALAGGGAAGGMGAGTAAFFSGSLQPGIETVLDITGFDEQLDSCTLIITGEGKIDEQSRHGKVISGVAKRAKKHNIPVVALTGNVGSETTGIYDDGVSAIVSINRRPEDFSVAKDKSADNLRYTLRDLFRLYRAVAGQTEQ